MTDYINLYFTLTMDFQSEIKNRFAPAKKKNEKLLNEVDDMFFWKYKDERKSLHCSEYFRIK